jgi:hypothetical protein
MGKLSRERLLGKVEEALKSAFPDRASALMRELRMRYWGAEPANALPRCRLCLRSGRKRTLVWGAVCGECLGLCHELLPHLDNPRATRPPPDAVLAELMRAVRASTMSDEHREQVLSELGRRFEGSLAYGPTRERIPCSLCSSMGPAIRGAEASICGRCVQRAVQALIQDRRLSGAPAGALSLAPLSRASVLALASDALRRVQAGRAQRLIDVLERFFWSPIARRADRHGCSLCGRGRDEVAGYVAMRSEPEFAGDEGLVWAVGPQASFDAVRPPKWSMRALRRGEELRALLCPACVAGCRALIADLGRTPITAQEAFLQAEGALGGSGQARSQEVIAALAAALAAMPQPSAADSGTCELCGGTQRPLVELPGLAFCERCLEGAEDALAR